MEHLSLLEFNQVVKKTLEQNLDPTYWIVAEIGEIRIHPKGHCYLELVEKQNEQITARMKATIWSYTYQNLIHWFNRITGSDLKEGMKILLNAEVQYHESYGLSLNIRDIDANYTLGERQKIKQQVLQRLGEEGLIRMNLERELPLAPQRIAVISSPHSAGFEDFTHQLEKSEYSFHVALFPSEMQGEMATRSIVDSFKKIFESIEDFDLVVILRGGGSQSDLDTFNAYLTGKAIARFPLPVITGIGHERDETVADIVARVKLKTPTAVAEFLVTGLREYESRLQKTLEGILGNVYQVVQDQRQRIKEASDHIHYRSDQLILERENSLSLIQAHIVNHSKRKIELQTSKMGHFQERVARSLNTFLENRASELSALDRFFHFSDPHYTLQRGFGYSTINGKAVSKSNKPQLGDEMITVTKDLTLNSRIEKID